MSREKDQPSMLTPEGQPDPNLVAQLAELRIRAKAEEAKKKHEDRLAKSKAAAEERGRQHSP